MLSNARSQSLFSPGGGTRGRVGLLALSCLLALAVLASDAFAGQLPVRLGKADGFAVLAGQTVTSAGVSTLNGDLGVSPGTSLTGFPPGRVNGTVHAADPVAAQAQSDLTTAYNDAAGRTPPQALPADVGGRTLAAGVYKSGSTLGLTGGLTLDGKGDRNAVFVFQVGSALTTAVGSRVNLIGGAQPCNVFWQIGSSATLGTSSVFAGNILALTSVSMNDRVTLNGRALARNGGVTLINDTITAAHCASGTTGGATPPGGTTGADTRLPASPVLLSPRAHARVRAGTVSFRWRGAARAEGYILMVDHHQMNAGPLTRATMRISAGSHSYRVIARNRYGARSSPARAFSATQSPSVDQIRRGLGLDVLQKDVVTAAERITLRAAEASAFRSLLRSLGKLASRASVLGFLVSIGLDDGDLSCEQGVLYRKAKPVFKGAADVLNRAARAGVGRHTADLAKLARVRSAITRLKTYIARTRNEFADECQGPYEVALRTIKTLQPRLDAAGARLKKLSTQAPTKKECVTALKVLRDFRRLVKKFSPGTSEKRLKELKRLLDAGTLRPDDLPGGVKNRAPIARRFFGKTIREIEEECRHAR